MRKMKLNVKVVAAFIAGAALAGSIATAAISTLPINDRHLRIKSHTR
jgi:hypothetical protein